MKTSIAACHGLVDVAICVAARERHDCDVVNSKSTTDLSVGENKGEMIENRRPRGSRVVFIAILRSLLCRPFEFELIAAQH
jgi:hypothetical protein